MGMEYSREGEGPSCSCISRKMPPNLPSTTIIMVKKNQFFEFLLFHSSMNDDNLLAMNRVLHTMLIICELKINSLKEGVLK